MKDFKDSVIAKAATGVVAFTAGLFMLGFASVAAMPSQASAQSNAELQAQIQSLLETIASLQSQVDGEGSAGADGYSNCSLVPSRNMGQGASGQDVKNLQMFLNMSADTQVAASGPGSPGQETVNYGPLTASAVSDFQAKYSADILAPLGLSAPTGYWGSSSRSKAQQLCAADPVTDPGDDDDDDDPADDDDDDADDEDELRGGEASLKGYDFDNGPDSDVNEGGSADVAEVEFDVENGDVNVSRIDVALREGTNNHSNADDEPWDVFEEVSIIVDGDEIASMDANDEDDYLDDDADSDGYYELRFTNLDWIVREGDTAEFTIAVEVQNNVDQAGDVEWDINIRDDGIRARDGDGINHYEGDDDDYETFDIDEEGDDDEFDVKRSSNNPDASTIEVDKDNREGWFDIFVFELDASDSENDIDIETIPVKIDLTNGGNGTSTIDDVISDLELVIDGETFDDYTITDKTATTSTWVDFDIDEDYTLEAGDEVDVSLGVEFEARDGNYVNGQQIRASVDSSDNNSNDDGDIEGEGADDIIADGSATGKWHTLLSEGLFAYDASTKTSTSGQNDTVGTFKVFFTVEAFEDDFHFASDGSDVNYTLNGGSATTSETLNDLSDGNEDDVHNNHYTVYEGEEEDFEFSVTVDPDSTGQFNVQLDSLDYGTTDSTSSTYTFSPKGDYKTSNETIQGS